MLDTASPTQSEAKIQVLITAQAVEKLERVKTITKPESPVSRRRWLKASPSSNLPLNRQVVSGFDGQKHLLLWLDFSLYDPAGPLRKENSC